MANRQRELALRWAGPIPIDHAYAGAFRVQGDTAYSYAQPIARKLEWTFHARRYAWVTSKRWSVTTSKHTNAVYSALTTNGFTIIRSETPPDSREAMIRLLT